MAVSKKRRFEVFKRDGFTCQYCGSTPPRVVLECDHVIPVCEWGTDDEENLVTSCFDCNRGKGGTPLDAVPDTVEERARRRAELKAQVDAYNDLLKSIRRSEERAIKRIGKRWYESFDSLHTTAFDKPRSTSVRRFLKALTEEELSVDYAMSVRPPTRQFDEETWRYFCGTCWGKIREDQA